MRIHSLQYELYEEDKYPWLAQEKKFIAEVIASKKNRILLTFTASISRVNP